jgi:hypothetical protein
MFCLGQTVEAAGYSHEYIVQCDLFGCGSLCTHVKWVPCHHGMARPQVADRGDGLQIWRVVANALYKQSRTAGCPQA